MIARLRSDHEVWIESYARPIITMTQAHGDTSEVRDLDLNRHGKELMDKVRSDLQAVVMADEAHRAYRVDRWRVQVRDMVIGLVPLRHRRPESSSDSSPATAFTLSPTPTRPG